MPPSFLLFAQCLIACCCAFFVRGGELAPPPDDAKQREAEKAIKEVYKAEYARTASDDRLALARKLLNQAAAKNDDAAALFVLCREARELAAAAGDIELAIAAVTEMARQFAINASVEKAALLKKISDAAKLKEPAAKVAEAVLKAIREAVAAEQFDGLKTLTAAAEQSAARAMDADLSAQAKELVALANDVLVEWPKVKTAQETLKTAAGDAAANLTVGKFHCFLRGDWKRGLPALAQCANKDWKALAEKELGAPGDTAATAALADGWWDAAEKMTGASKRYVRTHAAQIYKKCLADLKGIAKAKVEGRIAQTDEGGTSGFHNPKNYPLTASIDIPKGGKMDFVLVPAGKFQMGGTKFVGEGPVHPVTISKAFYFGKFEVTEEQYKTLMTMPGAPRGARFPAGGVRYPDAQEYCKKLSQMTGKKLRLPTEAEWEYACRAGAPEPDLDGAGWTKENSDNAPHEVGKKAPNAWGLYDMHGNMEEWCEDWYDQEFHSKSPTNDPVNNTPGKMRAIRGGSWANPAANCSSTFRHGSDPEKHFANLGLRLVMEIGR